MKKTWLIRGNCIKHMGQNGHGDIHRLLITCLLIHGELCKNTTILCQKSLASMMQLLISTGMSDNEAWC